MKPFNGYTSAVINPSKGPMLATTALIWAAACGAEVDRCPWRVDSLLAETDVPHEERLECGDFSESSGGLVRGTECFMDAVDSGTPAALTFNNCADCTAPKTFVMTSRGDVVTVELEADQFGDDFRTATVALCSEVVVVGSRPTCPNATKLYECQEPL